MPHGDSPAVVFARAKDVLGHLEFVADRSWPHGVSTVIEVRSSDGRALIVKSPADVAKFDAEQHAFRHWAPALEGHVPELVAAYRDLRLLVLSKVPGQIGDTSAATFREAGRLLRLLQDAEPSATVVDFADSCRVRFDTWVARARPGLLRSTEVDFVAEQLERVAEYPDPVAVPCHRDWQPRNWLTADDGTVSVIDFGNARLGYWFQDFERMWWNEWREVPALGMAFFDGFGSTLDVDARSQLRATSALWLLTTIVWSDEVGDETFGDHARRSLQDAMEGVPDPF
jgi:aminoglycoside phosphotransferase